MAGMQHHKMALDPALVRLGNMTTNRYKYFRWTPKNAWLTLVYVGIVPSLLGYVFYTQDGKWDFRAKRRGDLLAER